MNNDAEQCEALSNSIDSIEVLRSFVPPKVFDAHAHLYRQCDVPASIAQTYSLPEGNIGWKAYNNALQQWMGDRHPTAGLFFTYPHPALEIASANQFVIEQVRKQPDSRALLLIRPSDDPAAVEKLIQSEGYSGFKVYHVYADRDDTFQAEISEFLPEWAWEIANRLELVIMLHMVRTRALADPANQRDIRQHCQRYPHSKLILAHAARGFCGRHTAEGIESLRGLQNVFFDTSVVCEPLAMQAILRVFGPSRLLYGSDFPVTEMAGRCVSIGDSFLWLGESNIDWKKNRPPVQPTSVGIESLLALQQACQNQRLNDGDIENIFFNNARLLLQTKKGSNDSTGQTVYQRAKQLIPGGTQLLSKQPERYSPDRWPCYYREARGCEVIDLDRRRFIDMTTSGIGSCLLGYNDPDVTDAVVRRIQLGSMCTLNSAEEVELAELLLSLHPWAEQVRYCRTGGESMAVAVRIARAQTGRNRVAFCGYHGWSDWYLAANLSSDDDSKEGQDRLKDHLIPGLHPAGVPKGLVNTALPFNYNQPDELQKIIKEHGSDLAAVVMEPTRSVDPAPGFFEKIRSMCDQCGAALIIDEITAGWRFTLGGAHLRYGVEPDIAVFAKAIGNGHPMGAIIGRSRLMEAVQTSFISSTYWTEGVGPTAALATIHKMQQIDLPAHIKNIGELMQGVWSDLSKEHQVPVKVTGHPAILHLSFDHPQAEALETLVTVRMLDRGFLTANGFYPTLAHNQQHIEAYHRAADPVFAELREAIRQDNILERLDGPVRKSGFARLTAEK